MDWILIPGSLFLYLRVCPCRSCATFQIFSFLICKTEMQQCPLHRILMRIKGQKASKCLARSQAHTVCSIRAGILCYLYFSLLSYKQQDGATGNIGGAFPLSQQQITVKPHFQVVSIVLDVPRKCQVRPQRCPRLRCPKTIHYYFSPCLSNLQPAEVKASW